IASVNCMLKIMRGGKEEDRMPDALIINNVLCALSAGILLGLMIFVDNMAVFFVVPIFIYLIALLHHRGLARAKNNLVAVLVTFMAGLGMGSIPLGYYDLITTGNIFTAPYGLPLIGGLEPSSYSHYYFLQGLFQAILSPRSGLLLFTPFLIISIIGLWPLQRQGRKRESLLFIGLFLSILVPFTLQNPSTYLHNTIGPSELVLAVPFTLFPAISSLDRFKHASLGSFAAYLLAGASILINGIIALTDPVNLGLNIASRNISSTSSPLLTTNIQLFLGQYYLTWWSFFAHPLLYASATIALPLVVLIIYSFSGSKIRFRTQPAMVAPQPIMLQKTSVAEKIE
ncbi:MAG: hypothetical protein ACRDF4_03375, partial [Rhabdochlamydiaceae bacterium]